MWFVRRRWDGFGGLSSVLVDGSVVGFLCFSLFSLSCILAFVFPFFWHFPFLLRDFILYF